MKRQRSRNRGGGGKPQHNANRAFESNGPDGVKIRGAAQHVFEKYQQLARDALTAGDRILGESYQQHAEHYFRVLRAVQPQRPASDIIGRDSFASGIDIDFEDESAEAEAQPEAAADGGEAGGERNGGGEWRQDGRRDDRQRDQRPRDFQRDERRDDRPRDDRPREERFRDRDDRPRDDRARDERPRDDRPREDRYRDDRPRFRDDRERDRGERRFERAERAPDPLAVVEPHAQPLTPDTEAPASPMLRSQDGGLSQAPAFLQARPAAPEASAAEEGAEPRPRTRRRRAPRSFEGAGEAAPAPEADAPEEA
jgi:hypothetical protein